MMAASVAAQTVAELNAELYSGLIMGVGKGTFAVCICILISITCCFFKNSVIYPNLCIFIATLLPVIVFLFIYLMPKESLASDKTQDDLLPTSWYFLKTVIFLMLITLVFIFSLLALCALKLKRVSVKRIDSEIGNKNIKNGEGLDQKGYVTLENNSAAVQGSNNEGGDEENRFY